MMVTLIVILALLVFSAFFSGSETALTAASRPLMHQLDQTGNRRAALVNNLLDHKDRLIGTILLGNNLVNILATALTTSLLITLFGEAGVAYATIAITMLVLIFAEILPKTYAFRNADRMALAVAPVVNVLVYLLSPVTRTIQVLVRGLYGLFGAQLSDSDGLGTDAEELRGAIDLHNGDAKAIKHERAMLKSVLDLAEVQIGEIMIHRKNMNTIDADLSVDKIISQMLTSPFTRIPLFRGAPDNIVGVLHGKGLFRAVRDHGDRLTNQDLVAMAAKPWFVPETTSLLDQLQAFRQRRAHFALVVDEYGSLQGIVTLEDILEEIVGDITDEHDIAVTGARKQPDGSYIVEGGVTIRDLNRELEWSLPDEEAATVAGLVLHESRRIPEVGQIFRFHNYRFEILRRLRHQITALRITPPSN